MQRAGLNGIRKGWGVMCALLGLAATPLMAQYPVQPGAPAAARRMGDVMERPLAGDAVQIRELIGTGRRTLVKTPEYRSSIPKSSTRPKDWVQITVKFDTVPEWIDVLTMDFQVMTMTKVDGKTRYSIYHQTVDHVDVAHGRDHLTAVFIAPSAAERHGLPVAVHVSALVDGKVVAKADDVDPVVKPLPPTWWEDRVVLEKENVTVREGYLLRLYLTPFAFINSDDYEVMR